MSKILYGASAVFMSFGLFDLVKLGKTYTPTPLDVIFDFGICGVCLVASILTEKTPPETP